jgi:hypothetical protein
MWMLGEVESTGHVNPVLFRREAGRRLRAAREAVRLSLAEAALRLEGVVLCVRCRRCST